MSQEGRDPPSRYKQLAHPQTRNPALLEWGRPQAHTVPTPTDGFFQSILPPFAFLQRQDTCSLTKAPFPASDQALVGERLASHKARCPAEV